MSPRERMHAQIARAQHAACGGAETCEDLGDASAPPPPRNALADAPPVVVPAPGGAGPSSPSSPSSGAERHSTGGAERPLEGRRARAEREARKDEADRRWLARFEATIDPDARPPMLQRETWLMCQSILASVRGARYWLRWARTRFSGEPLAALRDAAFIPLEDGTCRFDFGDEGARRRIAEGLLMLRESRRRRACEVFGSRSQRGGRSLHGVSKACIAQAVTPAYRRSRPWHRNTLGGRTATWEGDFALLERFGFFARKRLPRQCVRPYEIGRKSGHVITRYWIACVPTTKRSERRAARVAEFFEADRVAELARFNARHLVGWHLADEVIARAPRARASQAPPLSGHTSPAF